MNTRISFFTTLRLRKLFHIPYCFHYIQRKSGIIIIYNLNQVLPFAMNQYDNHNEKVQGCHNRSHSYVLYDHVDFLYLLNKE